MSFDRFKHRASQNTMSARLGFSDPDLATPEHDDMVLWIKKKIKAEWHEYSMEYSLRQVAESLPDSMRDDWLQFYPHPNSHRDKEVRDRALQRLDRLQKNPVPSLTGLEIVLEKPIMNNKFIVGYADLAISAKVYKVRYEEYRSTAGFVLTEPFLELLYKNEIPPIFNINIEVKPKINSLGDVLRQIRTYQAYSGNWAIASPDRRFEEEIEEQGIMFLPIPPNYNQPAKEEFPVF